MNKWIGKGRLARDPDVRYTPSGKVVARFTLACDKRKPKGSQQQTQGKQPTADFIDCVAWDKLAELVKNYCGKGKELLVEGHMTSRSYEKDGTKRYVTEAVINHIEFCGKKDDGGAPANQGASNGGGGYFSDNDAPPISDDEIPF